MPLISVVIPLYNHEKYIEEAIKSVLNQTVTDFELIVINDGSEDKSEEVVQSIKDDRIKYLTQRNQGAHNTINKGINIAQGKYISILNSDDCYTSNRFDKCLAIFSKNPSIEAVFTGIDYINEEGLSIKKTMRSEENWVGLDANKSFKETKNLVLELLAGNFLKTTSNLFCRKECFETVGLFRNLRYAHDFDLFLRLSRECNVELIEMPLLRYRTHAGNTLKESQAAIDLECSLVTLDFILKYDMGTFFENINSELMVKIFNSLNTYRSEKIMLILCIINCFKTNFKESMLESFMRDPNNEFWATTLGYLENYHDGWDAREEILDEWNKLHSLYLASEEGREKIIKSKYYLVGEYFKKHASKFKQLFC